MIRIDLQPAYLLHSRPYRDTSALVDLLTLDYGLVRAVARGVRGRRRRVALQQHQPLLVSLGGRGELLTLNHVEAAAPGFFLSGKYLYSALYMNELLVRLLQVYEPHEELYRAYQAGLLGLQRVGSQPANARTVAEPGSTTGPDLPDALEPLLRRFEWSVLGELGYQPDLVSVDENNVYCLTADAGFEAVFGKKDDTFSGEALLLLQDLLEHPEADVSPAWTPVMRTTAKRLMRQALGPLLGSRPLMSRRLFAGQTD
ncbi:MAG: DNA repair protein RecO [Pseudohongiella sp.]|nr:DNA repair protein RecO [Pseudohongiella sp.]